MKRDGYVSGCGGMSRKPAVGTHPGDSSPQLSGKISWWCQIILLLLKKPTLVIIVKYFRLENKQACLLHYLKWLFYVGLSPLWHFSLGCISFKFRLPTRIIVDWVVKKFSVHLLIFIKGPWWWLCLFTLCHFSMGSQKGIFYPGLLSATSAILISMEVWLSQDRCSWTSCEATSFPDRGSENCTPALRKMLCSVYLGNGNSYLTVSSWSWFL